MLGREQLMLSSNLLGVSSKLSKVVFSHGCMANAQDQKRAIGLASAAASAPVFCILMLDACPTSG
jgi:hypothetical protein